MTEAGVFRPPFGEQLVDAYVAAVAARAARRPATGVAADPATKPFSESAALDVPA